jgi:hypothetical protein
LRRGYHTGTKERECHGFDEEVSLPTSAKIEGNSVRATRRS